MYSAALEEEAYSLPDPRQTESQMDSFRLKVRLWLLLLAHLHLLYRTRLLAQMQRRRNRSILRRRLSIVLRV